MNSIMDRINECEKKLQELLVEIQNIKSESDKPSNIGKSLIGRKILVGTKFKVINTNAHRGHFDDYVCLDEYIDKSGTFKKSFIFSESSYSSSATFDKEYMNAIDEENGYLCWRYDEVEILED